MATRIPNTVANSDGTITWTHAQGSVNYRESPSGTFYHAQTPPRVVSLLEAARERGKPIRLFYGDPATGKDWLEENDVKGKLGRSMGPLKVPLIIAPGEDGGDALLDHCIVRLQIAGQDVYRHPSYSQGKFETRPSGIETHPYGVYVDGQNQANFKSENKREDYLRFIQGLPKMARAEAGMAM